MKNFMKNPCVVVGLTLPRLLYIYSVDKKWMKKISSISIVSTLLMILFFLIPMSAKAQNMEYEQFQWSEYHYITPCAKQIANGENRPAICVSFYTQERDCDYIEIYRREGKSGNFKKIAKAKTYEAYYDTAIKVNKTYYYYAIPYWNATEEHGLQSMRM